MEILRESRPLSLSMKCAALRAALLGGLKEEREDSADLTVKVDRERDRPIGIPSRRKGSGGVKKRGSGYVIVRFRINLEFRTLSTAPAASLASWTRGGSESPPHCFFRVRRGAAPRGEHVERGASVFSSTDAWVVEQGKDAERLAIRNPFV